MSFDQLIEEIEKLTPEEREIVKLRLDSLQHGREIEESPELRAAIDEGLRSLREEPTVTLEELEKRFASWPTRSS